DFDERADAGSVADFAAIKVDKGRMVDLDALTELDVISNHQRSSFGRMPSARRFSREVQTGALRVPRSSGGSGLAWALSLAQGDLLFNGEARASFGALSKRA